MRILMLADTLQNHAGWGSFSFSMFNSLRDFGYEVLCLSSDPGSKIRLPKPNDHRFFWEVCSLRLKHWMKTQKFDLIYIPVEPYAKLYRGFNATPFVITMHGTYAQPLAHGAPWAVKLFSQAQERACFLTVASDFTLEVIPENLKSKTTVIPHGIDLSLIEAPHNEIDYRHGRPLVLSVGAIKPRKGFDKLIAGFSVFLKTHPTAHLVIVGQGLETDFAQRLKAMVADLNLSEHITFAGEVSEEDLFGWYRVCNVFALMSVTAGGFEGFGLVYLEANLFGKPSVGHWHSGAVSAIASGVSGYLVNDPNNPSEIAQSLEKALALDSRGVFQYAKSCNWKSKVLEYEKVFEKCLQVSKR